MFFRLSRVPVWVGQGYEAEDAEDEFAYPQDQEEEFQSDGP